MSLNSLTIRARLGLAFGLVLVLLVAVAATSVARIAESNRSVDALARVGMAKLVASSQAVETILRTARGRRRSPTWKRSARSPRSRSRAAPRMRSVRAAATSPRWS